MQTIRKRNPPNSPPKNQLAITTFTNPNNKRVDNKTSPARSTKTYAEAIANPFQPLSDDDEEEDEIMEEVSTDSSDATPITDNAMTSQSSVEGISGKLSHSMSRKEKRKAAKAAKQTEELQGVSLSTAAKRALEKARRAKDLLQQEPVENSNSHPTADSTQIAEKDVASEPADPSIDSSTMENQTSLKNDKTTSKKSPDTVDKGSSDGYSSKTNTSHRSSGQKNNITNPYQRTKSSSSGILHAVPQHPSSVHTPATHGNLDKTIQLKKSTLRPHIHRYTLRIKIISSKSEEDEQILVQKTLQKFFAIVLQGDPKSIIPPFFELDRADTSVPDISATFNVAALDSYYSLKRYFSRLSPRSDEGFVWSSIILAQSIPFSTFMEKTRHSLENQDFGLWPKATDHELAVDLGWLLYSTRQQDENRIAEMVSSLTGEKIGAKWKPIRTTDGSNRKKVKDNNNVTRVHALHLECASDRAQDIRTKLSKWYGANSKKFPDGTKMRLVPPFNTILSTVNRQKYASLITRQSALNSRLGSSSYWEMTTNLLLDRPEPKSGISLRQIMLSIPSQVFPGTPLFHTIDKLWRSENEVVFTFLPENESDARSIVAGLIPFLTNTADPWYLNMFTQEARIRQASSKWDPETRQVFSADEFVVDEYLADDDEYNKSDEPTAEKPIRKTNQDESNIRVHVPIIIDPEDSPKMYQDDDSVSTFNQAPSVKTPIAPSTTFTPIIVSNPPSLRESSASSPKPSDVSYNDDGESISKLSDTESRIESLEQDIKHLNVAFQQALSEMQLQSQKQESHQLQHDATLAEILAILKIQKTPQEDDTVFPSAQDNPPMQSKVTGGSSGAAGPG
jgi:hypothetical protein